MKRSVYTASPVVMVERRAWPQSLFSLTLNKKNSEVS